MPSDLHDEKMVEAVRQLTEAIQDLRGEQRLWLFGKLLPVLLKQTDRAALSDVLKNLGDEDFQVLVDVIEQLRSTGDGDGGQN